MRKIKEGESVFTAGLVEGFQAEVARATSCYRHGGMHPLFWMPVVQADCE